MTLPFLTPADDDDDSPNQTRGDITYDGAECAEYEAADHQRFPDFQELAPKPFQRQRERCSFSPVNAKYPYAELVGEIKNGRHGQWIADPDQEHGYRKVDAQGDGGPCGEKHLYREGEKRHEQAHSASAGHRAAIEMPKIGIV